MTKNILITGGAGFIGQDLVVALLAAHPDAQVTITDVIEPPVPAAAGNDLSRVATIKADLTDSSSLSSLLSKPFTHVYVLHGLMSGGSEENLDLGLKVNIDSVRDLLDFLRKNHPGTVVIFTSSTAIYGPAECVREFETVPQPKSSYGTEKLIIELLLNDYSRRGLLDGRIVRLPTVIVRPGAPSAATSSFASGIVRESLQGIRNALPVGRSLALWVCSPVTVVKNLVKIKDIPAASFGESRVVNLPGITVTVQEIMDAVEQVGGKEALSYIDETSDPVIERIVNSWPSQFDTSRALGLGLHPDGTVLDAVKTFNDSLKN